MYVNGLTMMLIAIGALGGGVHSLYGRYLARKWALDPIQNTGL